MQAPFYAISSLGAHLKCDTDIGLVAQQLQLKQLSVNFTCTPYGCQYGKRADL